MTSSSGFLHSTVIDVVRRSRRRVVWSCLLRAAVDGAVTGWFLFLAFGACAASLGAGSGGWIVFGFVAGCGFVAYLARETLAVSSLRSVAILLDHHLGYHDRVSSALEFSRAAQPSPFMRAHIDETGEFLKQRASELLPFPRVGRLRAMALLFVLMLVALLPHSDRLAIPAIDKRYRAEEQVRAGQKLVREITELRRQADIRGLKKLSTVLAVMEQEIQKRLDLVTPEDLQPPEEEKTAEASSPAGTTGIDKQEDLDAKPDASAVGTAGTSDGIRLSAAASYQPVGKFDSFPQEAYTEVFAELDSVLVGTDMFSQELSDLSDHVDEAGGKLANFAYLQSDEGLEEEAEVRGIHGGDAIRAGHGDSLDKEIASLQYRSFAEFLKRYAAHLGDKAVGQAKFQVSNQPNTNGEMFNISAPPPKDAKFSVQGVSDQASTSILQASPDQAAQVAAQLKGRNAGRIGDEAGGQPGGQGAGVGGGKSAPMPPLLPRSEGGEYLPLKGRLADGPSVIQVIDDRGRRKLPSRTSSDVTYREVFIEYAHGAEAELNSEQVPLSMREYIRDYFRSIRPGLTEGAPVSPR